VTLKAVGRREADLPDWSWLDSPAPDDAPISKTDTGQRSDERRRRRTASRPRSAQAAPVAQRRRAGFLSALVGSGAAVSPEELRTWIPVRRQDVRETDAGDGRLLLESPLERSVPGVGVLIARAAKAPAWRKFELEPVGAYVWSRCDGASTFDQISEGLQARFRMNRLEADAALAAFLQTLGRRGLIALSQEGGS
jgi:hypothetical protein